MTNSTIELQTIDSLDTALICGVAVAGVGLLAYVGLKLRKLLKKLHEDDRLPPQGDPVGGP